MNNFSKQYPTITRWITEQGWVELGADEDSSSLVRALDEGGLVWESDSQTDSVDVALAELEIELLAWFQENGC
ncbi:hypothetical protein HMY34_13080 [Thiothrix subterranea]|uniref:hypothetical protein n=1 Tax=Thiothrix subterranea TaxID=2735563 RepID=UPI00192C5729|nr:hypothetical protein [Thiothrix subterranea]QQZ29629.1 hypothetical protein HMY34_13080 [Thiothrix subterranea]